MSTKQPGLQFGVRRRFGEPESPMFHVRLFVGAFSEPNPIEIRIWNLSAREVCGARSSRTGPRLSMATRQRGRLVDLWRSNRRDTHFITQSFEISCKIDHRYGNIGWNYDLPHRRYFRWSVDRRQPDHHPWKAVKPQGLAEMAKSMCGFSSTLGNSDLRMPRRCDGPRC